MADPEQVAPATESATPEGPTGQDADTGTTATVEAGTKAATPATGISESQLDETFFDPKEVPVELQPAYKQMQRAFTKKTEAIKKDRQAIDAYRSFEKDPHGTIQRIAGQLGYSLSRGEAPTQQKDDMADWQPGSWQELLEKATETALEKFRQEQGGQLEPVLSELQGLRKSRIESMLDEDVPEWREYEDEMTDLLRQHPSLVDNPSALARLAIPEEVQQSKAMQAAMKRLQAKAESGSPSSGSTTRKEPSTRPKGPMTFAQAVEQAKKDVAAGAGISG